MSDDDFVVVSYEDAAGAPRSGLPGHLSDISGYIDKLSDELWVINQCIHDNPELGYQEYKAHALLTAFMKSKHGWKVTGSAYGLETAWIAVNDSGRRGPVVSFNVEMGTFSSCSSAAMTEQ
jgi:metal-dependent amidase/aminoacylase/carboxypeptidase family protein